MKNEAINKTVLLTLVFSYFNHFSIDDQELSHAHIHGRVVFRAGQPQPSLADRKAERQGGARLSLYRVRHCRFSFSGPLSILITVVVAQAPDCRPEGDPRSSRHSSTSQPSSATGWRKFPITNRSCPIVISSWKKPVSLSPISQIS